MGVAHAHDQLHGLQAEVDGVGVLVMLREHVHQRAEPMRDRCTSRVVTAPGTGDVCPEGDKKPLAVMQLVLAVDVEDPLPLPPSCKLQ